MRNAAAGRAKARRARGAKVGRATAGMAAMVSGIMLGACSMFGIREGTEEPRYTVLGTQAGLEIRRYDPRIAAETTIAADEDTARYDGFRRLAGYIFGGNHGQQKIAMTAPVQQQQAGQKIAMTAPVAQARVGDAWVIRFYMPAGWTMQTLPQPDDPKVRLVEVPEETVAVLRFTGARDAATIAERQSDLLARLAQTSWRAAGEPVAWFYDPPWTIPFLRRNEVAVPVAAR